jgi:glycosyltransferase involved in cell wall biosynthesis
MSEARAWPHSPKVSVAMITYNQESFVGQAIDSVLIQQTDFDYELIIGEDCSTDGTRQIVAEFARRNPKRIRPLLHEHNLGRLGKHNFVATLNACRGKYIAILEGDDYWLSPHKLQKQADYLDSHPDCAYCFHNVRTIWEDTKANSRIWFPIPLKEKLALEDILAWNFSPMCSVMFRNGLFGEFPDWYFTLSMGDWPLHILNAQHGNIGYLDEVMAVYRLHTNGIWTSQGKIKNIRDIIKFYLTINRHLKYRYKKQIRLAIASRYYDLAKEYTQKHDHKRTALYLLRSILLAPLDYPVPKRLILELISPKTARLISRLKQRLMFHETV